MHTYLVTNADFMEPILAHEALAVSERRVVWHVTPAKPSKEVVVIHVLRVGRRLVNVVAARVTGERGCVATIAAEAPLLPQFVHVMVLMALLATGKTKTSL